MVHFLKLAKGEKYPAETIDSVTVTSGSWAGSVWRSLLIKNNALLARGQEPYYGLAQEVYSGRNVCGYVTVVHSKVATGAVNSYVEFTELYYVYQIKGDSTAYVYGVSLKDKTNERMSENPAKCKKRLLRWAKMLRYPPELTAIIESDEFTATDFWSQGPVVLPAAFDKALDKQK